MFGDGVFGSDFFGGRTIAAQVQPSTPPRVLVTALAAVGTTVTIFRVVEGEATPVRGAISVAPIGLAFAVVDNSAPFGVPVTYLAEITDADGTVTREESDPVTLTVASPWITHPITGHGVPVTIAEWTERHYKVRQTLVAVAGRRAPIVVSDVRSTAASEVVLLTRTRDQLHALRDLLTTGDVLQIRPVCGAVEDEFIAIGDATETRYKPTSLKRDRVQAGNDWRRLVTMPVQVVDEPLPELPAVGDTLADLASYVPTTLADLATTFPSPATLLTIAETYLGADSA